MKKCGQCNKSLSKNKFSKRRASKDGLCSSCKTCRSTYQKKHQTSECARVSQKKYRDSKRGVLNNLKSWLKVRYGITLEKYDYMLESQNGVCAACDRPETHKLNGVVIRLAVDHDHKTGKVRGLLCRKCNLIIGMAEDNKEQLLQLALYLERTN